jgi:hypothetical protein
VLLQRDAHQMEDRAAEEVAVVSALGHASMLVCTRMVCARTK